MHFLTVDEYAPFVRLVKTHENIHQGRLTRSVLSNQRQDLALGNLQGDVITCQDSREALGDVFHP